MRPLSPALQQIFASGGGRVLVEARIEGAADVRQRSDQWALADGGLSANLEVLSDGGLTLKATAGAAVGPTTVNAWYHAKEGTTYLQPFLDPITGAFGNLTAFVGVLASRTTAANVSYGSLQAWLNPRFDTAAGTKKYVRTWELVLSSVIIEPVDGASGLQVWSLAPVLTVRVSADNEAAGWVVFPFQDAAGKSLPFHPELYNPDTAGSNPSTRPRQLYLVQCHGYDGTGVPATNIAWGYDNASLSFAGGGLSLLGWQVKSLLGGRMADGGAVNIPAVQFIPVSYPASATATFKTGSPIDLLATPATAPELVLQYEANGGSVLGEGAEDPAGSFVAFTDGQFTADVGLATQRKYDMRVTLNSSAAGDRAPIVRGLGARVVVRKDLGDVAEVVSWQERVDPITHVAEVGEITVRGIHDGARDFHDAISELVSQNAPGQFVLRLLGGDRSLSRDQWCFLDDFFPDDEILNPAATDIVAVSCLSLLRQALPVLSADLVALPNGLSSNPGVWTCSAGTDFAAQLADTALDGSGAVPDDTTYIQSPNNPSNAAITVTLAAISTPPQSVGATVQFRAAVVAASSPTLKVELLEGATVRATKQVTVSTVDAGQGSYAVSSYLLTPTEQAAISNWGNLLLRFTANGTGQVRVGWARLVVLGRRAPLVYPSSATPANTIAACMSDLITAQLGLDGRYQGPLYADTSPPLPVAKTLAASGSSTDLTRLKSELDALAFLGGGAFISTLGRLTYKPLYAVTAYTDLVTGSTTARFAPLSGPVRVTFDQGEIEPLSITGGWRQRIPIYAVPWGWTGSNYGGEASVTNGAALSFYRQSMLDADARAPESVSQWLSEGLARGIATRHSQAFGFGLLEWRFRCTMPHPELEIGDVIVLQTDEFLGFDPIASRALAGKLWVTGVIVGRWDALGREWSVWVQNMSAMQPVSSGTGTAPAVNPSDLVLLANLRDQSGGRVEVSWSGSSAVVAVKVASSTSSFPAAGTGTLVTGQSDKLTIGPFGYTDTIYVTVTPYGTVDASDTPGTAVQLQITLGADPGYLVFNGGLLNDGMLNAAQVAPSLAAAENDIVLNGLFEQGTVNWRQTAGGLLDTSTSSPLSGSRSAVVGPVTASVLCRIQQCDRGSDTPNSGSGSPVYTPVQPFDEIYGSIKWGSVGGVDATAVIKFGFEEYDATKTLIQRTYLQTGGGVTGPATYRGGVVLQSTTAYVVPIFEVTPSAGGGGITYKWDDFHLYRVPARQRCHTYRSTTQTITNNTETAINWDSETSSYDVGGMHDTVTNNPRITVQAAAAARGTIRLFAQIQWVNGITGYRRVRIRKNGVGGTVIAEVTDNGVVTVETTQQCHVVDNAPAAGDFYEVLVTHTQGVNLNVNGGQWTSFFVARHEY